MQLFRMESSDKSEKVLPRIAQLASQTSVAYAMLTLGCAVAYALAGMTGFEAVTHAMTTVSTGGYSTFDASLGHFANPAIEWIATIFMVLGALPFVIYIQAAHGRSAAVWNNSQIRTFLAGIAVVSLALTVWLWLLRDEDLADAFTLVPFNGGIGRTAGREK